MEHGVVKVVSPIDDTPAAKAGLQTNDLITHLDGEQIVGLTLEQAVEKMRGPVNTPITLTIVRKGKDDPFDIKIVRDVIRINAVKARAEGDVIYVKVSTFNEQTHANLVKAGRRPEEDDGKNLKGYVHRSARQPGRPARPGDRRVRRLPRQGRDRAHQGPRPGGDAARQRPSRRHRRRQAGDRADQRRLGLGLRDRRRRPAGPQARHHHRHALVRQGLGADHHPAGGAQRRHPPDHGALLHAFGPLDPGQGHRPGRHGRAGAAAGAADRKVDQSDAERGELRGHLKGERKDGKEELRLVQLRAQGAGEGHAAAVRAEDAARRAAAAHAEGRSAEADPARAAAGPRPQK